MGQVVQLDVGAVGRVEGDLDVRVTLDDGVVVDAWTEASMFRGFEIILKGKDPQAGLIVTPRICGICGGSHLYKACYALDADPEHRAGLRDAAEHPALLLRALRDRFREQGVCEDQHVRRTGEAQLALRRDELRAGRSSFG